MNKSAWPALFGLAVLNLVCVMPVPAAQAGTADREEELEAVLVTAQRAERVSRGATGLNLDIKDTPQSISVVTQELMQDFGATSLNDALRLATGINVEQWETNRANYMARGFDIVNTQVDGVGMPNDWGIVTGAMDSFGYEKLEVIRGANGLLTGVGNSSGTINYVRKRPTNDTQAEVNATVGSWDNRRIEADYSTPFTRSGSWAGRAVAAYEEGDSYLRLLQNDRLYLYGVVDGQIGARTTLTLGYSFQDTHTDGNMWGGLQFATAAGLDDAGEPIVVRNDFPRDATTAQDWTNWDTRSQNAFLELTYALSDHWTLKGTYGFRKWVSDSRLFYPNTAVETDPEPQVVITAYAGRYGEGSRAHLGDVSLAGRLAAFGREHELVIGYAQSHGSGRSYTQDVLNDVDAGDPDPYPVMPSFPWPDDVVAEPLWGPRYAYARGGQWLRRAYGAARISVSERVKAIAGFNYTRYRRLGISTWSDPYDETQGKLSPYAGLTVDITDRVLAYASYSDIYQPQDQTDVDHQYLDPTQGVNLELGVKADWLGGRLLTSLAWFSAKQDGLATQSFAPLIDENDELYWPYYPVDVESRGFEFEATGKLNEYASVVLGVTSLRLDAAGVDGIPTGADGNYPWVPRRTVNLSFSTKVPALPQLRLGLNGRWQSKVHNADDTGLLEVRQDAYALLNAFAEWKAGEHLAVRANVDNLTNRKYIGSVYWVGYYGAPRSYSLGIDYRF